MMEAKRQRVCVARQSVPSPAGGLGHVRHDALAIAVGSHSGQVDGQRRILS